MMSEDNFMLLSRKTPPRIQRRCARAAQHPSLRQHSTVAILCIAPHPLQRVSNFHGTPFLKWPELVVMKWTRWRLQGG